MRRRLLAAIPLAVLAVATPADAFHEETVPAQWSLMRVSPLGIDLNIGIGYGGCDRDLRVTDVQESATAVTLTVSQPTVAPDPGDGPTVCPAIASFTTLAVHLSHPLAGRSLVGQWRFPVSPFGAGGLVPSMIGARAGDAMRGMANQNIHTRLIGPVDGTVIRESPAPGERFSGAKGITLVATSAALSLELPRTVRLDRHHRLVVTLEHVQFHRQRPASAGSRARRQGGSHCRGTRAEDHSRRVRRRPAGRRRASPRVRLGMRALLRAPGRKPSVLYHESVVARS